MFDKILWYRQPAKNFNESLPMGNGRIGVCVYGGVKNEKISLNEDTLWSGYPRTSKEVCDDVYKTARKLVLEGMLTEAQSLLEQKFGDFLVQMYLPLGSLGIEMSHGESRTEYKRELSLETSVSTVSYQADGKVYTRECFVSKPAQIMAYKISCDAAESVSFTAKLAGALRCSVFSDENSLFIEGNCPICKAPYGQAHESEDKKFYFDSDSEKGVGYRAGIRIETKGGSVKSANNSLTVENANEAYIYFAVRTSFNGVFCHPVTDGRPYKLECVNDLEAAVKLGYDTIKTESIKDYQALFEKFYLNLGESENSKYPTDERLKKHADGGSDNALYTLLFNYGRYLTISASRMGTQAMNLQGIWNEELIPPWSCNYTLNINTEMNYWPTLGCGLFECYEPLVKLTKELCEVGRATARNYYGAGGFAAHHASDIWRVTHPNTNRLNNNTQWGFWCMSGGWLTKMLFDYYSYTKDIAYLKDIYPVILDCAEFYKDMLIEQNGELILCPSTSPENNYLTAHGRSPLDKTTTMTMSIVRDVFECAASAATALGTESTGYEALLKRLRGYQISSDGTLNEWYDEHEDWEVHHRHVSHLYGLFPSNQINDATPELMDACRKTLEKRGDGGTGWSLAWKINFWARLKDGEHAFKLLKLQLKPVDSGNEGHDVGGGSYPNLMCAHPPFQIDGNFGACSGILQMLVQTDGDEIKLLPALPEAWHTGELRGVYLPGGKRLDLKWQGGKVTEKSIYPI